MVLINKLCRQIICNTKSWHLNQNIKRTYAASSQMKVALYGASSTAGQPLSLMLKQSPYVDELALYDCQETSGLGAELQHIDTRCNIVSYGHADVPNALKGAQIVIILTGSLMTTTSYMAQAFDRNAGPVKDAVLNVAQYCPKACLVIAASPLEGMVPLASEVMKLKGVYNAKQIFGVSTLNAVRANAITAATLGLEPECVVVPIVGGNTGNTIVPVLTEAKPFSDFSEQEIECITISLQKAQDKILKSKSSEAAVLSSAFAIARFVVSLIKGLKGQTNIVEYAFVRTCVHPATKFMTVPVVLGLNGINKDLGLPALSSYEKCMLDGAFPVLREYEDRAREFLGVKKKQPCDPCDPSPRAPLCPEDYCEMKCRD